MENQAFLKKAAELAVLQAQAFSNRQIFATHIPNMFIVPYDEFEQQYGSNLYLDSDFDVLICDGDLTLAQGTINNQWLAEQFKRAGGNNNSRAMFVSGNLLINGNIIDDDYLFLQVAKDVSCHYLHSENGNIVIGGNLTALQGISGEYNDGMLHVLGKIIAHYIVSNDHAMPSSSIIEYIYVLDGKIGKGRREDWLGCWEFFENSEIMFKDGICEEENCINFSVFFDFVKNGENPFVDFETFENRKADWDAEQEPEYESDLPENPEEQTIAEILYLEKFSGSDEELYEYMVSEYQGVEKISDESEKYAYGGRAFEFSIIAARMAKNWRLITERYSAEKIDILRQNIIKSATDLANYFLKIGDKKQLLFIYQFLNDDAINIEEDEPYLYETVIRVSLALEDYDSTYELVSVIEKKSKFLPKEMQKSIADVLESDGYHAWLAKR